MAPAWERLPAYLKKYVVQQDYDAYTSEEHATWRYIMRQSRDFFAKYAVPVYQSGLKSTGIPLDRIPKISEMDQCLGQFGWGAVCVEGFIPSSVFLDLLARGILPIAADMRTFDHIGYTPAPDIVHEAAGHAPILADPAYRRFLERYSHIAYRAIISEEDINLYEAIRYLSDIKENPDTLPGEVERANERLKQVAASMTYTSEAGKVARLAWWTIEYGMTGPLDNPKIYGAGLLSSVLEGRSCISKRVPKRLLDLNCLNVSYDITEPQPQLFVARDLDSLPELLDEFEQTLSFKRGGVYGLEQAKAAKTVNTVQLEQKVGISGALSEFFLDDRGVPIFLKFSGECQLSHNETEIVGHGRSYHAQGYSSPVGRWQRLLDKSPSQISDADMASIGLQREKLATLDFSNGFKVQGQLDHWLRSDQGHLLLVSWSQCTVTRGAQIYYQPDWGPFDMIVGETVTSVYAGPADRMAYGDYNVGTTSTSPGRKSPFTPVEKSVFSLFDEIKLLRQSPSSKVTRELLAELAKSASAKHPQHWLLALELLELAQQKLGLNFEREDFLKDMITTLGNCLADGDLKFFQDGLSLIAVQD